MILLIPSNVELLVLSTISDSQTVWSLRRHIGSLCVFSVYIMGSVRHFTPKAHTPKAHYHNVEAWHRKTRRASHLFFPRPCKMWNGLTLEVFPLRYYMGLFKILSIFFIRSFASYLTMIYLCIRYLFHYNFIPRK